MDLMWVGLMDVLMAGYSAAHWEGLMVDSMAVISVVMMDER